MIQLPEDIKIIDCNYLYPKIAASYLVFHGQRACFVENNTENALGILLSALKENNISPESVDYLMITHLHLDHSGASGALLEACPNAMLVAHPKARRHLIKPERLVNSAKQVYGEKKFQELYGRVRPVPENRIMTMEDGQELSWQNRTFRFIHTLGHASHHMCIYDTLSNGIFTGDAFGLAYPALQKDGELFIMPAMAPPEFEEDEALRGIEKIVETGAQVAYLTHFGAVSIEKGAIKLRTGLNEIKKLLQSSMGIEEENENLIEYFRQELRGIYDKQIAGKKNDFSESEQILLGLDIKINAMGLAYRLKKIKKRVD